MHNQITVVVGVDAKTLPQLEVSHRTWKLHHPEMFDWPWVIFHDWTNCSIETGVYRMIDEGLLPKHSEIVGWPICLGLKKQPKYESQRERMLSGHVWVPPRVVKTPWYLKIDTDAVCLRREEWPRKEWADCADAASEAPSIIAPSWHYTKGVGFLDRLEDWGDKVLGLPRLNIPHDPTHLRVPHPRWCSWLSFYVTEWARSVVTMLEESVPLGTLPVPSQDTFHWYVAERTQRVVRKVNMKACGWTNCPKMNSLVETVRKVMMGEGAITDG